MAKEFSYFEVKIVGLTTKAAKLRFNPDSPSRFEEWVPRSLIEDGESLSDGETTDIGIETWKAEQLNLL